MSPVLETLLDGLGFVEGVRFHAERVWFSDFWSRHVRSFDQNGSVREEAYVPGQPSGLGFAPDGALLFVSTHDARIMRRQGSSQMVLADVGAHYRGALNDMLTTQEGHSYVSAFPVPNVGRPTPDAPPDGGSVPLFLILGDGEVKVVAEGLKIPNGITQSPDGRTLFVAESLGNRISAFPIRPSGTLGERRTYADLGTRTPDGLSIDRQGRVWFGSPFSSEFVRLDASGKMDEIIEVPGRWAVSCAVGERDDELYCGTVKTDIEQYKQGRGQGAIERWSR
jgi:sugar lactone lactonase YvrE